MKKRVEKTVIWKRDLQFIWSPICTILKPPWFNMEKIKINLMGLMMLFRKREIKTTKKQKDVAHVVMLIESHLRLTNRKIPASAVLTLLFVTRKRKVGLQSSHWPKSKSTCWSQKWLVNPGQQLWCLQQHNSILSRKAFKRSAPVSAKNHGNRGIYFRVPLCLGTYLKVTML